MPDMQLPIGNGFYVSESLPVSAQECTNWWVNIPQTPALNQEVLFGTPGIELLESTGAMASMNRGAFTFKDRAYFVNGDSLYRLNRTVTESGDLFDYDDLGEIEGSVRVSMATNGTQLMILVPGGKGYIFTDDPDALTEITDPDFRVNGDPQLVRFIDSYFVATTDSKKFIISAINDGLSWDGTDFGSAEANPDDTVAPIVFRNELFIGGSKTMEGFQNNPTGADFPFRRTGLYIEKGIYAKYSVVNTNDTFMFIGGGENESPAIWAYAGNTVNKVSTTAIDSILQRLTVEQLDEVFGFAFAQRGAYFACFALPESTLMYNTITGRWNEWKSQIVDTQGKTSTVRNRVNSVTEAYGRLLVGDAIDGRIGSLDPDIYREYGRDIIRVIATQPFQNNMNPLFFPELELTVESGVGNVDAPDPKMRMARSKDGGKTYGDDRTRPIGKKGEYRNRVIWRRVNRAERFDIFRFVLSDPVKPVIIQLTAKRATGG